MFPMTTTIIGKCRSHT